MHSSPRKSRIGRSRSAWAPAQHQSAGLVGAARRSKPVRFVSLQVRAIRRWCDSTCSTKPNLFSGAAFVTAPPRRRRIRSTAAAS